MTNGPRSQPPDLPNFRHLGYLGGGGFADVFLYEQLRPVRQVAVKVLRSAEFDPAAQRGFDAEADLMARVSAHPYIVTIFGADIADDGRPFLVMEYYSRPHLGVRARQGALPVADVLQLGVRLASAVETAHRAGILHRDIKPANVLVNQYGRPGLTDFGIAASDDASDGESRGVSVPFAAPEVVSDQSPGDERSDVYSLAATLYTLLAGRSPFEVPGGDNSVQALAARVLSSALPRIGRQDVPPSLELLLAHALSRDPSQRPRSAAELGRALQGIEREQGHTPTEFELADDGSGVSLLPAPAADDESTRGTRIQVVHQAPVDPATAPRGAEGAAISGVPSTFQTATQAGDRVSLPVPEPPSAVDTIARAVVGAPPENATSVPADAARPGPRSSSWPIAAAAVVLVVLVGTVLTVRAGGDGGATVTSTTSLVDPDGLSGSDGLVGTEEPPLPSDVQVTLAGSTATVRWTPGPGAEDGDKYLVERTTSPDEMVIATTETSTSFEVGSGENRVCVVIETRRDQRESADRTGEVCS